MSNQTYMNFTKEDVFEAAQNRQTDFNNLLQVLNKKQASQNTLFEFYIGDTVFDEIMPRSDFPIKDFADELIYRSKVFKALGYDHTMLPPHPAMTFPTKEHGTLESLSLNDQVMIRDLESFNDYKWPQAESIDYTYLDKLTLEMPQGMKAITIQPNGILENLTALVGFDNLCFMLFDQPDLVKMITDKIGRILYTYYEKCLEYDVIGACMVNDDWGFSSQPMISPKDMRTYIVPWHKKIVKLIHDKGRKAIMHSCGNLWSLMDDIINDIGFDGKHSYEDNITSVEEAYERLDGRIAVLGGIDIDFLSRKSPEEIYERAVGLLAMSKERGGYALGSGNSIPAYIPLENYYAMLMAIYSD